MGTLNAIVSLFQTLYELLLWIWILRILLQVTRADFYNPISQLVWRVTRQPTDALRRALPPVKNFNVAAALVLLVLTLAYIYCMAWIYNRPLDVVVTVWYALLKIVVLTLQLLVFTVTIQAIMSWLGPGVNNPASNILWSINEPLLRPVRRLVPPVSGLDLSPMVVILALLFVGRLLASQLPGFY